MNENSSQTIKELSEDQEIKNSSELDNDTASQNEEDLSLSLIHISEPTRPY